MRVTTLTDLQVEGCKWRQTDNTYQVGVLLRSADEYYGVFFELPFNPRLFLVGLALAGVVYEVHDLSEDPPEVFGLQPPSITHFEEYIQPRGMTERATVKRRVHFGPHAPPDFERNPDADL
jgi:hypothetical protein